MEENFNTLKYKKLYIGDVVLYIYKMSISSSRDYIISSSVSGRPFMSNNTLNSSKIKLFTKVSDDEDADNIISYLEDAMNKQKYFNIESGNIVINSAFITDIYFYNDINSSFNEFTITLLTEKDIIKKEV